jgi:O-antigen ligase
VFLTTVLCLADGPLGPLLVGYALLVASSGMFCRVRLVWFTTFVNVLSFVALVKLRPDEFSLIHYAAIFALVLTVVGFIVAHQVYRVRVLSRFYDRRSLP